MWAGDKLYFVDRVSMYISHVLFMEYIHFRQAFFLVKWWTLARLSHKYKKKNIWYTRPILKSPHIFQLWCSYCINFFKTCCLAGSLFLTTWSIGKGGLMLPLWSNTDFMIYLDKSVNKRYSYGIQFWFIIIKMSWIWMQSFLWFESSLHRSTGDSNWRFFFLRSPAYNRKPTTFTKNVWDLLFILITTSDSKINENMLF